MLDGPLKYTDDRSNDETDIMIVRLSQVIVCFFRQIFFFSFYLHISARNAGHQTWTEMMINNAGNDFGQTHHVHNLVMK